MRATLIPSFHARKEPRARKKEKKKERRKKLLFSFFLACPLGLWYECHAATLSGNCCQNAGDRSWPGKSRPTLFLSLSLSLSCCLAGCVAGPTGRTFFSERATACRPRHVGVFKGIPVTLRLASLFFLVRGRLIFHLVVVALCVKNTLWFVCVIVFVCCFRLSEAA